MEQPIPRNVQSAGKSLWGLFETRNVVEAAIAGVFIFSVLKICMTPLGSMISLIGSFFCAAIIAIFCLIGINNQPVSVALMDLYAFRLGRRKVTLRMPHLVKAALSSSRKRKIRVKRKRKETKK